MGDKVTVTGERWVEMPRAPVTNKLVPYGHAMG
jgi:hypothetical protein